MSPELAVPSLQLRPSFLRRLFGEHFVVIFLSKISVAQILNECSGKEADGLNTHSQPEDLPYQAWLSNLLFLALQLCWRKSKGEKEKSCSKAAREEPRADHLLIHMFPLCWDKPHLVAQPGPGGHCSWIPHGWSLAAITFQLRELRWLIQMPMSFLCPIVCAMCSQSVLHLRNSHCCSARWLWTCEPKELYWPLRALHPACPFWSPPLALFCLVRALWPPPS